MIAFEESETDADVLRCDGRTVASGWFSRQVSETSGGRRRA